MVTRWGLANNGSPPEEYTNAWPDSRRASWGGAMPAAKAALAFLMWLSHSGLMKRWTIVIVESSITSLGTDGGSWEAITIVFPWWRISRMASTIAPVRRALSMY